MGLQQNTSRITWDGGDALKTGKFNRTGDLSQLCFGVTNIKRKQSQNNLYKLPFTLQQDDPFGKLAKEHPINRESLKFVFALIPEFPIYALIPAIETLRICNIILKKIFFFMDDGQHGGTKCDIQQWHAHQGRQDIGRIGVGERYSVCCFRKQTPIVF